MSTNNRLIALQAELDMLIQADKDAQATTAKARFTAWTAFQATRPYEYKVTPSTYREFCSKDAPVPSLRIVRRYRPDALAAFKAEWTLLDFEAEANRWVGVEYYRTDENILTHGGGGTLLLKDPKLCNDEEWAELTAGRIPDKFLR